MAPRRGPPRPRGKFAPDRGCFKKFDDRPETAAAWKVPRLRLAIVKRSDDITGFVVPPRRWVVERTFSWFGRNRRLAKGFENLAETLVTLASIQLAIRRLARA
jgi:transposase